MGMSFFTHATLTGTFRILYVKPIKIVHIIPTHERVINCHTPDAPILSQVQIIPDLPDDFSLAKHATVMFQVF